MHGDALHGIFVGGVVLNQQVRAGIPHLDGLIGAAGGNAVTLCVEGHTIHTTIQQGLT